MGKTIKLTEKGLRELIKEAIDDFNDFNGVKIYHRAGMHTRLSLREVIRSICKNGLTTSTATDGDGIGNCIWFTTDFDTYGTNGKFVVSMELTDDKIEKYHINCNDFPNAYAYRDIPFNELKIEKIPLFYVNIGGDYYFTNLDGVPRNRKNVFDFLIGIASSHKNNRIIMFVDAWDYFNEPYDLEKLNNFANIEVSKIME